MVLRKYILNGTIVNITQHETDRVMEISISSKNDFNETVVRKLLVEIMGRNSNIILVDESMKILDSMKKLDRLPADTVRSFRVGIIFIPRKITAMVFLILQRIVFNELLANYDDSTVEKFFIQAFLGINPILAKRLLSEVASIPLAALPISPKSKSNFCGKGLFRLFPR